MKNTLLILSSFAFLCFLVSAFAVGQARTAIAIENEKQFCINKGFTDLKVCREWWITSGDVSRKR